MKQRLFGFLIPFLSQRSNSRRGSNGFSVQKPVSIKIFIKEGKIIMEYYRVKPEFDNYKMSKHYDIFIGNELFTEKEFEKVKIKYANRNNMKRSAVSISATDETILMSRLDIVEIPKSKTYWMFGARFEKKD